VYQCKHCGVLKARHYESPVNCVALPDGEHEWELPVSTEQLDQETVEEFGRRLVAAGYMQTSHRYRHVGRVPPGKTAVDALADVSPSSARRLAAQYEQWARAELLRVYSSEQLTLSIEQFAAFRKAGGEAV
jgi:hypothetical protein